ncbi:MAG: NADH-quinone oxidoreductase subunit NuoN [Aestuariivita sp.]|nr:NADH-quinone oxidoreductase subunit NuoN [Aestuariivita sp.]MCY4203049.1 NADH-quinone oxidoreductase subunit NuoN [Aestuariivita sp.]MCY4289355.1 NADH-quinone oxidoreductase subunit NuoN [Aestuariivita sp.]MCY4347762.1 NADH-quinone oxidoreductase subunit NuoN [Aestuariivita sp.]
MTLADFLIILPELVLATLALIFLIGSAYGGGDKNAAAVSWCGVIALILMAVFVGLRGSITDYSFGGLFIDDAFARFCKVMILVSAGVILLMTQSCSARHDLSRYEYPVLILLAVVGMMIMVSASDLMTLYMGLELQSLSLYVVASMQRDSIRSTEAGLKYFVLGALSSGLLLFGASLIYGFTGTTQFSGIIQVAVSEQISLGLLFGLMFVISGLAFKVSAVPFHMWTPDVYEGSATPVTAFFATAPKVAAMALIARVLHDAFAGLAVEWTQVIALLSVLSMFFGAITAIGQRDIKRLMAYSSIAHMGYGLMGLAAGTAFGVQALLIYMVIYVVMNVGTFSFILMMERDGQPVTEISALTLISRQQPIKALSLLILLFSLAGVPPMLGFFGKFYVLKAAYEAGLIWLAVAGVIASVIGAYYYLRIVFLMYFGDEPIEDVQSMRSPILSGLLVASAAIMLIGIVNLFGLEDAAQMAAEVLVG